MVTGDAQLIVTSGKLLTTGLSASKPIRAHINEEGVIQRLNLGDDHVADIALRLHWERRVLEVHHHAVADDDAVTFEQILNCRFRCGSSSSVPA